MSTSDNKKNVFTTIGSYTSFLKNEGKQPEQKNTFPSINNKKDVIPFLVDTLKVIVGMEAVKLMVGSLLSVFLDRAEKETKTFLIKEFTGLNANSTIPNEFHDTGYSFKVPTIDIKKKFSVKIDSKSYDLLRDDTIESLENSMHDAVRTEVEQEYAGLLKISYNKVGDNFIVKSKDTGIFIKDFVKDYINKTQIINKKEIQSTVMNYLFGSISKNEKKTVNDINTELQTDKIIQQLIEGNDSFEISQNDLDQILKKAQDINAGLNYNDLGCGLMETSLNIDDLQVLVDNMMNYAFLNDPFNISTELENTLENKTNIDQDIYQDNKQTIKDNFFQKIINSIILSITNAVTTSPQIRLLIGITSQFNGNSTTLDGSTTDTLKNNKTFIKCMVKIMINMVSEFIYNEAIKQIKELIKPIMKRIAKERMILYSKIMKSLAKPI